MSARVYTIPSGVPFLRALAQGLLERHPVAENPFALAEVMVFLPTRRGVRALEEAFLDLTGGKGQAALLLPRMRALGDVDEEEILIETGPVETELASLPAVSALHRRIRLAQLLMHTREMPFTEAISWSKSLARFLDETLIEEVDLQKIEAIVPADLSAHFQKSLEFIRILTEHWQGILASDGFIEAAERRRLLMSAEAERWKAGPPKALYIAGSTGSIPATARLMAAALEVPNGIVILPGLDRALDETAWAGVDESHPQFGLKHLLLSLGVDRSDIVDWPYVDGFRRSSEARARLLAETLRPAPTTDSWARALSDVPLVDALLGLSHIEARDRAEEARVIAFAMREALDRPGETAALVTPDRPLARRVAAELKRWGVEVDDSAGSPLAQTQAVVFLRLIVHALSEDCAPVPLLALLKHPLAKLGYEKTELGLRVSRLERAALRGPRPAPGLEGVLARLERVRSERRARLESDEDKVKIDRAIDNSNVLIARLQTAIAPLTELIARSGAASAQEWAMALARAAENLGDGVEIWRGDDGEAAANLLEEIGELKLLPKQSLAEFADILEASLESRVIRPRTRRHPRLFIWGPLEARLQSADLMILGGLNEGTWPAHSDDGPWANRIMRKALGLSTSERRIGLSAHDFQELASAPRVLLTSSQKVDGSPALPSRWLMRLKNFLEGRAALAHIKAEPYEAWARGFDEPKLATPMKAPEPRPEQRLRPRRLSITEIKRLRRDPYAIYARHILKLRPLDPIDEDATAKLRGTLFHEIMEVFGRQHPDQLPREALRRLMMLSDEMLVSEGLDPEIRAIWRSRLKRAGEKFIEWEEGERGVAKVVAVEARGEIDLPITGAEPFHLIGRIDRIDQDRASRALAIIDYKTGRAATLKVIKAMLDPQLPLSALLVREGAIAEVVPAPVERLIYLNIGGGSGKTELLNFADDVPALVEKTRDGLIKLIAKYDDADEPYLSWPIAEKTTDKGDYDLLARTGEWRVHADEDEW
ncbi:MAG: double-strand break repair protein AddB [Alphaproteobacteria bacterium]